MNEGLKDWLAGFDKRFAELTHGVVKELALRPDNRVAVICGPPAMIKLTVEALKGPGWSEDRMYTTLEMKMQCGIGQCGRCNIGERFICQDGPVFRLDQLPSPAL